MDATNARQVVKERILGHIIYASWKMAKPALIDLACAILLPVLFRSAQKLQHKGEDKEDG
jgi:hypothetical protein